MGLSKPALSRAVAFVPQKNPGSLAITRQSGVGGLEEKGDSTRAAQGLENVKAPNSTRTCSEEILGRGGVAEVG